MNQREKRRLTKQVAGELSGFLTKKLAGTQKVRILCSDEEPFCNICLGTQSSIIISWFRTDFIVAFNKYFTVFVNGEEFVEAVIKSVTKTLGEDKLLLMNLDEDRAGGKVTYSVKE